MADNHIWAFKGPMEVEYTNIFRDLVPADKIPGTVSVVPTDLNNLQKQFDDEESTFDKECGVIKTKSADSDAKLVELCREIGVVELVEVSKQVALEELNTDAEDHAAHFEQCCELLPAITTEIIPSPLMEMELDQEMSKALECYDSSYSMLGTSKEENTKISNFIENYQAEYEHRLIEFKKLENILFNVQEKLECIPGLEDFQVDLDGISLMFDNMQTEMSSFNQQIGAILDCLFEDFQQSQQRIEQMEKEFHERKKVQENLKNKRTTLRNFYHECVQKTEDLFRQGRVEDELFEKAVEESQRRIEELNKECQEKESIFEEATKKATETAEALDKLKLNHSKLEEEESNIEITYKKLKEELQQMEAEEVELVRRQTEIKVQMAVERTLQEQLEELQHFFAAKQN